MRLRNIFQILQDMRGLRRKEAVQTLRNPLLIIMPPRGISIIGWIKHLLNRYLIKPELNRGRLSNLLSSPLHQTRVPQMKPPKKTHQTLAHWRVLEK